MVVTNGLAALIPNEDASVSFLYIRPAQIAKSWFNIVKSLGNVRQDLAN